MRPALALLACEAFGGPARRALPAAVSIKLVRNASLLHDDVIDGARDCWSRPMTY